MSPKTPLWRTTLDTIAAQVAPQCSNAYMGATQSNVCLPTVPDVGTLQMHCAACAGKVRAAVLDAAKPLLPLLLTTVLKTLEGVPAPAGAGTEDTDLPQAAAGKAPGCGSLLAAPVHDVGLTRCALLEVKPGAYCLPGPVCGGLRGCWGADQAQALPSLQLAGCTPA